MACMKFLNRNLIIYMLAVALLSTSSFNPSRFLAQGRQFPDANLRKDEEFAVKMRAIIGSGPPRCKQRCRNCGHCEAIQVPIASTKKIMEKEIIRKAYSRGDDISNYKPMCWKCKCGDSIFNP